MPFDVLSGFTHQDRRPEVLLAIDQDLLTPLERIALTLDGTLTSFLEALKNEPVRSEPIEPPPQNSGDALRDFLDAKPGLSVIARQSLLRGETSGTVYVAARSALAPNLAPAGFLDALKQSRRGIGEALVRLKAETYRELLWCGRGPGRTEDTGILCRAYRIIHDAKPFACVEEAFLAPLERP